MLHLEGGKRQGPLAPLGEGLGRVPPEVGAEPVLAPAGWLLRLDRPEGEAAGRLADRLPDFALGLVAQAPEQDGRAGEVRAGPEGAFSWGQAVGASCGDEGDGVGVALGVDAGGALVDGLGRGVVLGFG